MQGTRWPARTSRASLRWPLPMRWPKASTTRARSSSRCLTSPVNDTTRGLEGTKTTGADAQPGGLPWQDGHGTVDAYQLLMQIEGNALPEGLDRQAGAHHPHAKTFGGSAQNLTYRGVETSRRTWRSFGMTAEPGNVQRPVDDKMHETGCRTHHRQGGRRRQPPRLGRRSWAAQISRNSPSSPETEPKTEVGYKRQKHTLKESNEKHIYSLFAAALLVFCAGCSNDDDGPAISDKGVVGEWHLTSWNHETPADFDVSVQFGADGKFDIFQKVEIPGWPSIRAVSPRRIRAFRAVTATAWRGARTTPSN